MGASVCLKMLKCLKVLKRCPEVLAAKEWNDRLTKDSGCSTLSCLVKGIVLNKIFQDEGATLVWCQS